MPANTTYKPRPTLGQRNMKGKICKCGKNAASYFRGEDVCADCLNPPDKEKTMDDLFNEKSISSCGLAGIA